MTERHFATAHLIKLIEAPVDFDGVFSPEVHAAIKVCANHIAAVLDDGPELTIGLRHLLDAKQSFVAQAALDAKARLTKGES